jgi:uncharacterized protein YPO0396
MRHDVDRSHGAVSIAKQRVKLLRALVQNLEPRNLDGKARHQAFANNSIATPTF